MKTLTLVLLSLFIFNIAGAQSDSIAKKPSDYKTLFKTSDKKTAVTGFGAINIDFGYTDNNLRVLPGLDLAALFNHSFFVGFYGRMMATSPSYDYTYYNKEDRKNIAVSQNALFGHGGLLVGGIFYANNPIHFGISGRFGFGGVALYDNYDYDKYNKDDYYYNDYPYSEPVFVFSPQADFEMNITNWFKFRLSAGYQYVSSYSVKYSTLENKAIIEKELLNTSSFSTPTVTLGFVFGWFK